MFRYKAFVSVLSGVLFKTSDCITDYVHLKSNKVHNSLTLNIFLKDLCVFSYNSVFFLVQYKFADTREIYFSFNIPIQEDTFVNNQ